MRLEKTIFWTKVKASVQNYIKNQTIRKYLTKVLTRNFISFSLQDRMRFKIRLFFRTILPLPVCTLMISIVRKNENDSSNCITILGFIQRKFS